MVLVDSSVWIEYLAARNTAVQSKLDELLKPNNQVVMTGIIFQEVLQGIRDPALFERVRAHLSLIPAIFPTLETHLRAAEIFIKLASKGKALTTIDAFLAALALAHGVLLFSLDRDFRRIASEFPLKFFQ